MEFEHYHGMTEKALSAIVDQAQLRWHILDALVIHHVGPLLPLDQLVLVAVSSAHHSEAFAACEFIIDYLETEAPFWKKEHTSQGARCIGQMIARRVADSRKQKMNWLAIGIGATLCGARPR